MRLTNPYILLTFTALFWGGNAVAGKFAVGHVSPMVLTFGRWFIAFVLVSLFAHKRIAQDLTLLKQRWLYLLLMGGIGFTVFNVFLYSALHYTSAINVTIEQTAMPFFIFVMSFLAFRIAIQPLQIVGYALTVIGVLVTASYGEPLALLTGASSFNRGDVLMLFGSVCYAGYSVGLRLKPDVHWLSLLWALVLGGLIFSIFGLGYETARDELIWPTTTQGIAVIAYAGLFPSLVSQAFYMMGVGALGANRAGIFINLVPVFAAILSVLLLGENLHPFHGLAFILVVGGVLIAQKSTK